LPQQRVRRCKFAFTYPSGEVREKNRKKTPKKIAVFLDAESYRRKPAAGRSKFIREIFYKE
jgi:hypothetical protein